MSKLRHALSRRASAVLCAAVIVTGTPMIAGTAGASATLRVGGSIDEAWLIGANPGDEIHLLKDATPVDGVPAAVADAQGAVIMRNLGIGNGYSFEDSTASTTSSSGAGPCCRDTIRIGRRTWPR